MNKGHENIEVVLQSCLELIQSGQETIDSVLKRYPDQAEELRMELEASLWLQSRRKSISPRPEFIADSRRSLLTKIEKIETGRPAGVPSPPLSSLTKTLQSLFAQKRFAYQFALSILLVALLVISSTGVAFASQWAIPGDTLYPVKLSLEDAQLALSFSDMRRAELHIKHAEQRMFEIQNLVVENRFEYLHDTISRFEVQTVLATRLLESASEANAPRALELANQLQLMLAEQAGIFPVLAQVTPQHAQDEIERLISITAALAAEAEQLETPGVVIFTPTPTATLASTNTLVPPTSTQFNTATSRPSATVGLTATPAEAFLQITPLGDSVTGTTVPTLITSGGRPPTDTPVPTVRPTKTQKPNPGQTRRPPKPTKKPKETD